MAAQPAQADLQVALAVTQDYASPDSGPPPHDRPAGHVATLVEAPSGLIGQRVGQYRVRKELGRGGMGVVYQAEHEEIGQRAALKTLHAEISANPQFKRRFLNELRARTDGQQIVSAEVGGAVGERVGNPARTG